MKDSEVEKSGYQGSSALSPIPMTVSSPPIKAIDKGKIRTIAVESMHLQANQQVDMLRKQAELIVQQVAEIEERVKISEMIYSADMTFVPVINSVYHLYERKNGRVLSLISPKEWGKKVPFEAFVATVRLLADHTWDVIEKGKKV